MKKILIPIFLISYISLFSQNFDWAINIGGTDTDMLMDVTVDNWGNVYSTGFFKRDADFDPGEDSLIFSTPFESDAFIQKLDTSGNLVWAKQLAGPGPDIGNALTVDATGNVYITGLFSDTTDFDPGEDTLALISAGYGDIFVQKLDVNGNLLWAKSIGGTYSDRGNGIAVDLDGNIYVTGTFTYTVDFNPGDDTLNLISPGGIDAFILKLDASGEFVWVKQIGGGMAEDSHSLILDESGNIYITGTFGGTVDFDPGIGIFELEASGYSDAFVQKLDSSGELIWVKSISGSACDESYSVAVDATGNVYTTGYFEEVADFNPGPDSFYLTASGTQDIYIQKLDPLGNFVWAKGIGGTFNDNGRSIDLDALGNVYTTGYFAEIIDFDPGSGTHNLVPVSGTDVFILKLDALGNFIWAKGIGSDFAFSLAVDGSGNIFSTGYFYGTVDFDMGMGIYELTSHGGIDIFLLKLSQNIILATENNSLKKINIFPNPINDKFTIDLGKTYKKTIIKIYDISGKLLEESIFHNMKLLNLSLDQPAGIYVISINSEEGFLTFKVIKK